MLADDLQPYLDRLRDRDITNRDVARELGVAEESVCRALKRLGFQKNAPASRKAQSALYAARQALRLQLAHTLPPAEAAAAAHCSVRTIYRFRAKPRHDTEEPQP